MERGFDLPLAVREIARLFSDRLYSMYRPYHTPERQAAVPYLYSGEHAAGTQALYQTGLETIIYMAQNRLPAKKKERNKGGGHRHGQRQNGADVKRPWRPLCDLLKRRKKNSG